MFFAKIKYSKCCGNFSFYFFDPIRFLTVDFQPSIVNYWFKLNHTSVYLHFNRKSVAVPWEVVQNLAIGIAEGCHCLEDALKQLQEKVNHNFQGFFIRWNQFFSSLWKCPFRLFVWILMENWITKSGFALEKLLQKLDKPVRIGSTKKDLL